MSGSKHKFSLQRVSELLLRIGAHRDGFLILITLIYVTGYVTWSVLAWKQGFGPIPVLDAQYFVAGLPIIMSVILTLLLLLLLRYFLRQVWGEWLKRQPIRTRMLICRTLMICSLIGAIGIIANEIFSFSFYVYIPSMLLLCMSFVLLGFSSPLTNLEQFQKIRLQHKGKISASSPHWLDHFSHFTESVLKHSTSLIYVIILAIMVAFALNYSRVWYYKIPQELGGGAPHPACIDLDCSKLSSETVQLLVPKPHDQKTAGIARSREVSIFFVGRDFFLIGDIESATVSDPNRFKISREVIKAVHWKR